MPDERGRAGAFACQHKPSRAVGGSRSLEPIRENGYAMKTMIELADALFPKAKASAAE